MVDVVDYDLWLRRRASEHVFLREAGGALVHMDTRVSDSKFFAECVVDIVGMVLAALPWRFLWTSCKIERLLHT